MSNRHNPKSPPALGSPKLQQGTPVVCSVCHQPGGTLIKNNDGTYSHKDKEFCKWAKHYAGILPS